MGSRLPPTSIQGATIAGLTSLSLTGTATKPSSASAAWNALSLPAATLTLTGTTHVTTTTGVNLVSLTAPTITDVSSVTVDIASTLYVGGPPAAGGSVTLTTPLSLWVDSGNARFDGQVGIGVATTPAGTLEIVVPSDTTQGVPTVYDAKFVTVGTGGATGNGIFFSWYTAGATGHIGARQPGTAQRTLYLQAGGGTLILGGSSTTLAYFAGSGTTKATVTGAKGSNAALASLMTALAGYGLVTDSTSA